MEEKNHIGLIIGVVVIIALLFGVSYFITRDNDDPSGGFTIEDPTDTELDAPQETITAKHQFKEGKHIVAGEIGLPTPCHILDWDTDITQSQQESREYLADGTDQIVQVSVDQVTINLTSSSQAEACAQVITPARFKAEFEAGENAQINMTLNGKPVTLNLIEAGPGENLEDFELFIKG